MGRRTSVARQQDQPECSKCRRTDTSQCRYLLQNYLLSLPFLFWTSDLATRATHALPPVSYHSTGGKLYLNTRHPYTHLLYLVFTLSIDRLTSDKCKHWQSRSKDKCDPTKHKYCTMVPRYWFPPRNRLPKWDAPKVWSKLLISSKVITGSSPIESQARHLEEIVS